MIRLVWEQTAAVASDAAAAACAGACAAWGRNNLMIAPDDPERAAERVIDAAGRDQVDPVRGVARVGAPE